MSPTHGIPTLLPSNNATPTPSNISTSPRTSNDKNKKPWFSIRETFTIDSLRKKTFTNQPTQKQSPKRKPWTPPALRPITLLFAIAVSIILLVVLQILLLRSQRDQGVIFAPDIEKLPLSRTFLYQYFPTIVAVFYSIFWSWIDLETKRVEPWYRLSRKEGCEGKDGLLLTYPSSFMPLAPLKALRDRHWPVFWAAFALVLVAWGLVPVQSGIFSTHPIVRNTTITVNVSTYFMPASEQEAGLSIRYSQSTYGIVALNETLPPFMTLNYTLAPFVSSSADINNRSQAGELTASTIMYSLDLHCEPGIFTGELTDSWNSTWGCRMSTGLSGNNTKGANMGNQISEFKKYSGLYAGYSTSGMATYYIDYCPPNRTHTFYAAFTKNKQKEDDPPNNVTSIFCEPVYYEQDVNATIDRVTKRPTKIVPLGAQRNLPENVFNRTLFDIQLADTTSEVFVRGDFMPSRDLPNYIEQIADTELSLGSDGHMMNGLSAIMGERPLQDYVDWKILASSYEKAYRILFARAMADILGSEVRSGAQKTTQGHDIVQLSAVYLEPVFTYIVEGLLAMVVISAAVLLYLSKTRSIALLSDPNTIASIMSLVADNPALLAEFKDLDCCTAKELEKAVSDKKYRITGEESQISISTVNQTPDGNTLLQIRQRTGSSKAISKPVRPKEFSRWMSIPFVGLFIILATVLVVLFVKARANGLSLPSKNKIVQNILENYIPTAFATLIEPMWVLMNRLLCLLQPFQQLSKGNAKAKESIELDYSSLPPQLVIWKALKARHVVLTAVCAMALLTNLLAVSFAGLFVHKTVEVRDFMTFQPPLEPKFVSINGSVGPIARRNSASDIPSGAWRGGQGQDQFLIAESNITHGTSLPAWVDDKLFYMPFKGSVKENSTTGRQYEATTTAFGAELDCSELGPDSYRQSVLFRDGENHTVLSVSLKSKGTTASCIGLWDLRIAPGPINNSGESQCQTGSVAAELVYYLGPASGANASKAERDICWGTVAMGWLRDQRTSCDADQETKLEAEKSFFVQCRPRLVKGHGTVRVDEQGRLLRTVKDRVLEGDVDISETNSAFNGSSDIDLISQSNRYLFQTWDNPWHNDTFASDFFNYFVRRAANSSRLIDPKKDLPTLQDVQGPLNKAYSSLFAIWLATNKEHLLVSRANESSVSVQGWRVGKEERLFLKTALFAIALGILSINIVVAVVVYLRRPGKYLPRLPTSIASIIGLFAASAAVHDMRGTSTKTPKELSRHFQNLGSRYGYGNYVGVDGGIHVGIEKTPFVRPRRSTMRKQSMLAFRKASAT